MISYDFTTIANIFMQCLKDCCIFQRNEPGMNYFEVNDFRKDNALWLIIGAGLHEREAKKYFPAQPKRIERALIPLKNGLNPGEESLVLIRLTHLLTCILTLINILMILIIFPEVEIKRMI